MPVNGDASFPKPHDEPHDEPDCGVADDTVGDSGDGSVAATGDDEQPAADNGDEPVDDSLGARQRALLDESTQSLRADAQALAGRRRALQELDQLAEDPTEPGSRRFLELEVAGSFRVGQMTAGAGCAKPTATPPPCR